MAWHPYNLDHPMYNTPGNLIYFFHLMQHVTYLFFRPSTTRSTPPPVMCGALAAFCMRYGVLDTIPLKSTATLKSVSAITKSCISGVECSYWNMLYTAGYETGWRRFSSGPTPWLPEGTVHSHDHLLVCHIQNVVLFTQNYYESFKKSLAKIHRKVL